MCSSDLPLPVEIATTPVRPETATGVVAQGMAKAQVCGPVELPVPSCPPLLSPQHLTVPPVVSAQVWWEPAATATMPVRGVGGEREARTVTGVL